MNNVPRDTVAYIAVGLLAVSILIHLVGGISELFGVATDHGNLAYAVLMLLGALLPVVLMGAMGAGIVRPEWTYGMLSALMVVYVLAYADVHAFGTFESITGIEFHADGEHEHNGHDHGHSHDDHSHGDSALETVVDHLLNDPRALLSKVSESIAAVLFAALVVRER